MVVENPVLPFWQWFLRGADGQIGTLPWFLIVAASLSVLALVCGYFVAASRHGPLKAGDQTYKVVMTGLRELLFISPRRIIALTRLAIQESIRRRVLVAFVVFVVILLFASWFLEIDNAEPLRLYLSFVMTATTYLVLLLALLLSTFSLPNDIKSKTFYTVVTKPVRAAEIVMGRILGFVVTGTMVLVVMGVVSYFFIVRTLSHTHVVDVFSLSGVPSEESFDGKQGLTTQSSAHRHEFRVDAEGNGETSFENGHWHKITGERLGDQITYDVGGPQDMFHSRVPVYGKLRFKNRLGSDAPRGISVGNEWTYRSYIEGGTRAAAIWTFDGVTGEAYPEGLPVELTLSIFRTHKGDIEKGVLGSLTIKNPADPDRQSSEELPFEAKEFSTNQRLVPRKLSDGQGRPIDLFRDLVHDGRVEIWVQCLEPGQYFGVAQADCYLEAQEGRFAVNFVKGYFSVWMQMLLVICFGVTASTFLSGPVAVMFTVAVITLGFFKQFILSVATGEVQGGGPVESLIRLVMQKNVTLPLDPGISITLVKWVDEFFLFLVKAFAIMLPDFSQYSAVSYVADGFSIPSNLLGQDFVACLAYLVGLVVIGYFALRIREVGK